MNLSNLQNKSILILGFGKEGQETLRFLRKHFPEKKIGIADKNSEVEIADPLVDLHLGRSYLDFLDEYDVIIKTPGIPFLQEMKSVQKRMTSAMQIFFDLLDKSNTVVAVTGSKGKSTVSSLIFEIVKALENDNPGINSGVIIVGNIGTPALSAVDVKNTIIVCELSSYQLEGLTFSPDIAVWTSFFPDHLDYHGGVESYFLAKTSVTTGQKNKNIFLYHERYKDILKNVPTEAKKYMARTDEPLPKSLQLKGAHNRENIQLALKVSDILDIPRKKSLEVVKHFSGLPHRLEELGEYSGIYFIDDAISTTPESTIAALNAFSGEVDTILLGGTDRGYDFSSLIQKIQEESISNVVLFPDSGEKIKECFIQQGGVPPFVLETERMEEAVQFCFEKTQKGKIALLSTASPSYRLWKNFEAKGDEFQKWVKKIGKEM